MNIFRKMNFIKYSSIQIIRNYRNFSKFQKIQKFLKFENFKIDIEFKNSKKFLKFENFKILEFECRIVRIFLYYSFLLYSKILFQFPDPVIRSQRGAITKSKPRDCHRSSSTELHH